MEEKCLRIKEICQHGCYAFKLISIKTLINYISVNLKAYKIQDHFKIFLEFYFLHVLYEKLSLK